MYSSFKLMLRLRGRFLNFPQIILLVLCETWEVEFCMPDIHHVLPSTLFRIEFHVAIYTVTLSYFSFHMLNQPILIDALLREGWEVMFMPEVITSHILMTKETKLHFFSADNFKIGRGRRFTQHCFFRGFYLLSISFVFLWAKMLLVCATRHKFFAAYFTIKLELGTLLRSFIILDF